MQTVVAEVLRAVTRGLAIQSLVLGFIGIVLIVASHSALKEDAQAAASSGSAGSAAGGARSTASSARSTASSAGPDRRRRHHARVAGPAVAASRGRLFQGEAPQP